VDDRGRTPLEIAMLRGDLEAMRRLEAAGARTPAAVGSPDIEAHGDLVRDAIRQQVTPMLCVPDVAATVAWYASLGFTLESRHPDVGDMDWASIALGGTTLMVQSLGSRAGNPVALWFHTNRIDDLYEMMKGRQLEAARAAMAGEASNGSAIHFLEDLSRHRIAESSSARG
jgi:hypothetical protein